MGGGRVRDLHPDLRAQLRERADHALPVADSRPPAELLGRAERVCIGQWICLSGGLSLRDRERIGLSECKRLALAASRDDSAASRGPALPLDGMMVACGLEEIHSP